MMNEKDIPETCENPDEKCEREPIEMVRYAIANSPRSVWDEFYLCSQCSSMFYRGTTAPKHKIEIRRIYDE